VNKASRFYRAFLPEVSVLCGFLVNSLCLYADKVHISKIRETLTNNRGIQMGIQNWSEEVILVDLPTEPEMGEELVNVTSMVRDRGDCDVVIDFSQVDIVTSSSLSKMLKLRKLLTDCGHKLLFCSVAPATKGVFTVTGLDGVFEFADDKFVALASLQIVNA
jgi:anti-anti-sigma factor